MMPRHLEKLFAESRERNEADAQQIFKGAFCAILYLTWAALAFIH